MQNLLVVMLLTFIFGKLMLKIHSNLFRWSCFQRPGSMRLLFFLLPSMPLSNTLCTYIKCKILLLLVYHGYTESNMIHGEFSSATATAVTKKLKPQN